MKQIALGQEVIISSKRKGRCGRKPSNCDLSLICTILLNRRSIVQSLANLLGSTTTLFRRVTKQGLERENKVPTKIPCETA
jgi:hypothetical protein